MQGTRSIFTWSDNTDNMFRRHQSENKNKRTSEIYFKKQVGIVL